MQSSSTIPAGFNLVLVDGSNGNRGGSGQRTGEVLEAARAVLAHRERLRDNLRRVLEEVRGSVERSRTLQGRPRRSSPPAPRRPRPGSHPLAEDRRGLHETYAATGDPAIRARLMKSYDGLARSLALKFRHRESVDDLVQVARIGLLHALDRFDPARGRPFPVFARITITGELKRYIRDRTWAVRVPRSLQEDYLNVMRAVDDLTTEQSASPSVEALAERCALTVERVFEALGLWGSRRAVSIDAPLAPDSPEVSVELGAEDTAFDQLENSHLLAVLLARLPERDRRIVKLRFVEEMTQSEIAAEVGVSQMCVSRVLTRTLDRLRLWARTAVA